MRVALVHDINDYNHECCLEGHSSVLFAQNADEFHTVDIDISASNLASKTLKDLNINSCWNVHNGDGIKFLNDFEGKIDLLFLDAWDIGTPNYAENHLAAFQAAQNKLSNKHIILIDDTDINFTEEKQLHHDEDSMTGKGSTLIPFLISKNYTVQFNGRQSCFTNF